ncbi:peptidylprolyl isomerase [Macrococcus brunensis]|uniref:peptidylprolyl isomerase n=1 Tax=Macrococcus brunensis TaxID=198483 RepID=A0A4R6BB06_9STAP|nr:peptidylprolyl isomerase [Macrococcus brunensis]TDL94141.1 peptidylprolyl isomerase [Macrococcus brunensis]ULG71447.1 peptidylprolyl isomerase [Macrococcus brunensis]ULG73744.1 peptidylprolyl isomerase [Macrococcus brunensis]
MKNLKKAVVPALLSVSVLGLTACGNGDEGKTLITSKAGDVTTTNVMDQIGKEEIAQNAFQILLKDILKDKYGKKVDEKKIQEDVDAEIKKYGGKEQFEALLQQQSPGMTADKYKESRLTEAYQKQLMNDTVKVSDEDVKDSVKKASHILIKVKSSSDPSGLSDEKAKAKAQDILAQLKKDPSKFASLAKKESGDTGTKEKGGELGYVAKGDTVPEFEKALFKLKEGAMSGLVKTDYGYHIIKAEKQDDFAKQKDALKEKIRQTKVQEKPELMMDAYKKLLKDYNVEYKDEDLKKIIDEKILNAAASQQQQ